MSEVTKPLPRYITLSIRIVALTWIAFDFFWCKAIAVLFLAATWGD